MDTELDELEEEFEQEILEEFRCLLSTEFEYLSSRKAIEETILANDFDFLEDGTLEG
jgi:hypothetical protein